MNEHLKRHITFLSVFFIDVFVTMKEDRSEGTKCCEEMGITIGDDGNDISRL